MLKVISGGQTGVDRAALDVAIETGIDYGGWCPKGGLAEDLASPPGLLAIYGNLRATPSSDPRERTEWNARDSDALLVLVDHAGLAVSKGTAFALEAASRHAKPSLIVDLDSLDVDAAATGLLVARSRSSRCWSLCVAGPRESEAPGIYAKARIFLRGVLACSGGLTR